jgi:RNA polymerase sigma factor (sigma-70 family)
MGDVSIPARAAAVTRPRSRRLLALARDERLVEQIRRGNEAAFEVVFERHTPAILAFCRHMLGSPEEAEDAVQHTFAAAYRDLRSHGTREVALKPWLFTIARNRCLSMLRSRREHPLAEPAAVATVGLAEQVEQRAELRRLLADLGELPDEQRAALLLTEVADLSHAEVAGVLGCEVARVKALVFRARSGLIARREAREAPCEAIREQLANLRGGALRRTELRLHLRECPGCRAYREQVKHQRRMLAAALPVAPTLGLKSSVLAAIGLGGGSAGGLAAAGGFGGATVAKVAVVAALAGGGVVAGDAVVKSGEGGGPASAPAGATPAPAASDSAGAVPDSVRAAPSPARTGGSEGAAGTLPDPLASDRPSTRVGGLDPRNEGKKRSSHQREAVPPGQAKPKPGRRRGHERKAAGGVPERGRGRGPIAAPPATPPVKRGPPEKPAKPETQHGPKPKPAPNGNAGAEPEAPPPVAQPPELPKPKGTSKQDR